MSLMSCVVYIQSTSWSDNSKKQKLTLRIVFGDLTGAKDKASEHECESLHCSCFWVNCMTEFSGVCMSKLTWDRETLPLPVLSK